MRQSRYGPNVRPPLIDEALARELEGYRGHFVAIDDGQVVAAGDTPAAALERAREQVVPDPLLHHVPLHPERAAFYVAH